MMDLEKVRQELQAKEAVLIDVREQQEWDNAHLQHAQLYPLGNLLKGIAPPNIALDQKIYLHCRSGNRSETACALMKAMGYKQVFNLKFGFQKLQQLNL